MAITDISAQHGPLEVDRGRFFDLHAVQWSRIVLWVSMATLALAPLFISDTYSLLEHTLSESGAQGVPGAWIHRSGVVLAAFAVLAMTSYAGPAWSPHAKGWLRIYSIALILLAVFPESPWYPGPHDATVARLHTVAGVVGAISFIIGVVAVSSTRQQTRWSRLYDVLVVCAVLVIPQLMLLWSFDGILQRLMVAIGYGWLFLESNRMIASKRLPA